MSESTFNAGDKVNILDISKFGEVVSVSDEGVVVKYTDDAGAEQTDTFAADRLTAVSSTEASASGPEKAEAEGEGEENKA